MNEFYVIERDGEHMIAAVTAGNDPLYGRGSWNLASGPYASIEEAEAACPSDADFEAGARLRVEHTPGLSRFSAVIFYGWPNWAEHMRWIATAPVAEIVDWCETVTNDGE